MNVTALLRSRSVSARGVMAALMLLPLVAACDFTGSVNAPGGKKHSFASQETVPNGAVPNGAASGEAPSNDAPSNDARPNQRLSKEADPNGPVPAWVSDQADVIPAANEERITQSLAALEQRTGHQLVVVTVPSLEGESVEDYTFALANKWGMGRKGYDDGAVILVAPNERKMRIELGRGLDCFISNAQAQAIIDREMVPRFKANDMERGIEAGAAAMVTLMDAVPEDTRAGANSATCGATP